ncbi:hypothetical protein [Aliamphritea spongicola]|nr:hypothetical protein [Aliamphritea spongicola]
MVASHYSEQLNPAELLCRVKAAFPEGALPHQLAGIDQLHIGGIRASKNCWAIWKLIPAFPVKFWKSVPGWAAYNACVSACYQNTLRCTTPHWISLPVSAS